MARIEFPDGSEVYTPDEQPTKPERRRRIAKKSGMTGRQRFEAGMKKLASTAYDYMSGEGDDLDRALELVGLKEKEPPTKAIVPYDPDFD